MGDKSREHYRQLSSDETQNFNIVTLKFNNYFKGNMNITYERARFNLRCQVKGESVEPFITDLHIRAKNCNFGDLHEELIHDRIVVGCIDSKLSERLQMISDLTLNRAVRRASQSEKLKHNDVSHGHQKASIVDN